MKRFLQRLSLLLAVLLLLTTAVFADFGPKPQLVVRVEQPPQEEYYLDLLDMGDWAKNLYDLDERELDPALLAALRAAVPSGWHARAAAIMMSPQLRRPEWTPAAPARSFPPCPGSGRRRRQGRRSSRTAPYLR